MKKAELYFILEKAGAKVNEKMTKKKLKKVYDKLLIEKMMKLLS